MASPLNIFRTRTLHFQVPKSKQQKTAHAATLLQRVKLMGQLIIPYIFTLIFTAHLVVKAMTKLPIATTDKPQCLSPF